MGNNGDGEIISGFVLCIRSMLDSMSESDRIEMTGRIIKS